MLIEAILAVENSNRGEIHLVRDRLFYQAWELSAYLFVQHFRPYKVHHKFYQKIGKDLVWLGFPKSVLGDLEQESIKEGFQFDRIHEDHIVIQSIPFTEGFEDWKQGILSQKSEPVLKNTSQIAVAGKTVELYLPAYKLAYDLALHIYRTSAKFAKEFRYSLGERLRICITDLLESLHLFVNHIFPSSDAPSLCLDKAYRIRIELRLLKDLCQINVKQWGYLNQQLESLIQLLRPEFHGPKSMEVSLLQSSDPLPVL